MFGDDVEVVVEGDADGVAVDAVVEVDVDVARPLAGRGAEVLRADDVVKVALVGCVAGDPAEDGGDLLAAALGVGEGGKVGVEAAAGEVGALGPGVGVRGVGETPGRNQ